MRIKQLSISLSLVVVLLTVISLGTSLLASRTLEKRRMASQNVVDVLSACEMLREGCSALASAIQGFAATGDERYRVAYLAELDHLRNREWGLEKLRQLNLSQDELHRLENAKYRSDALLKQDEGIFEAVAKKDFKRALAEAWDAEYVKAWQGIEADIRHVRGDLQTRLLSKANALSEKASAIKVVAFAVYGLNFMAVLVALMWFFQKKVVSPLTLLTSRTRAYLEGDRTVDFKGDYGGNEVDDLARALVDFRKSELEITRQRWINNGLVEIVSNAQAAETLPDFGRHVMESLAPMLHLAGGAMYFCEAKGQPLVGQVGYGWADLRVKGWAFPPGESLMHEALALGLPRLIKDVPGDHFPVQSGLGSSPPVQLVWVPLSTGEMASAVFELATFAPPDEAQWGLIQELPRVLCPYLEILLRARRSSQLLEATQVQALALEKQAEELFSVHGRLRAVFDAATFGIMLVEHRKIRQCNRRLEEILGVEHGELDGEPTRMLYLRDEDWAAWDEPEREALTRGEFFRKTQQFKRRGGQAFWGRMTAHAIDKDDPDAGTVAVLEDITVEWEASEALRRASEEQQAIFEAASSGIVLVRNRVIIRCNRQTEVMFGYEPGELIGKSTRPWYESEAAFLEMGQAIAQSVAKGEPFLRELLMYRKDGSAFWSRLRVQATDKSDPSRGVVGLLDDITLEREYHEKLKKAVEAAEAANQAKSVFLANMSHEIRTPMNAVLGYAQLMLRDSSLQPTQREFVETINNSGNHLLELINGVLEMSKIEAGRIHVDAKDFDFPVLLSDIAGIFRIRMEEKGLDFSLEIEGDVPRFLHTDPMKIKQVIINVVGNALKFTDHGEVAVRVSAIAESGRDLEVVVEVKDTGLGIAEGELAKVFEAFEQASGGIHKGGTGLGMAISRQYARLLGGDLTVESRAGEGSIFRFSFKPRLGSSEIMEVKVLPREVVGLSASSRVAEILVVDDVKENRGLLRHLLGDLGFKVKEAANGKDALQRVSEALPDLVLMDWVMPVMSGLEATRRIKADPAWKHIPVVMLTASVMEESRHRAGEAGVDGYLRKPIRVGEVLELIQHFVPGVQYLYADEEAIPHFEAPSEWDFEASLSKLSAESRQGLRECVELGEMDRFSKMTEEAIAPEDPLLARQLLALAEKFEYRKLLGLLQ